MNKLFFLIAFYTFFFLFFFSTENNSYGILKLHKSDKLIDENFVFLKRDENATTIIDDSNRLARLYENCFYRNENSALDICDDKIVS